MVRASTRKAFTLIELLVVVAIIALLISILLPSLSQAREQGKKAVCINNLKSIAQASHSYSADDAREQIVPYHQSHVREFKLGGFSTKEWQWRTAEPVAYGGRTATREFPGGGDKAMMDPSEGGTNGSWWLAHTRPLNKYVYGDVERSDAKKLEMFHCPSDTGYPNEKWIHDAPVSAKGGKGIEFLPTYEVVGNSYRYNPAGVGWGGLENITNEISVGAKGHTVSSISTPSRVVLYTEPLFYNFSRQDWEANPDFMPVEGWHKKLVSDQVAFCDGSARLVKADKLARFDDQALIAMGVADMFKGANQLGVLRRGKSWQTDCYPTPGAQTDRYKPSGGKAGEAGGEPGWPFDGHSNNTPP